MSRFALFLGILLALCSIGARAGVTVRTTTDFAAEGQQARAKHLPLLVMFYADGCRYCRMVEEDFLKPMLISGDYKDKVIIRRINIGTERVRDFDGREVPMSEFQGRYHVRVTPTVLLLDADGKQLTKSLVGIASEDFYGGYLDDAIASALDQVRSPVRAASEEPLKPCSMC